MKTWEIKIGESTHHVTYDKGVLTIDSVPTEIKRFPISFLNRLDIPIKIGEKECRFVLVGQVADIVIDDLYVDSKEIYRPITKIPLYSYIFSIIFLSLAALGFIFGTEFKYTILICGVLGAFSSLMFGLANIFKKWKVCIVFTAYSFIVLLLLLLDIFV